LRLKKLKDQLDIFGKKIYQNDNSTKILAPQNIG